MPQPKVKVYNPVGPTGYTSLKSARHDVKRGRARWLKEDALVEYIAKTDFVPACRPLAVAPPAQSVNLKVEAIDAGTCDSNLAQTFLAYPQRSLDSYSGNYPGLAQANAGLG